MLKKKTNNDKLCPLQNEKINELENERKWKKNESDQNGCK